MKHRPSTVSQAHSQRNLCLCFLFCGLLFFTLVSCGDKTPDYSADQKYQALFSSEEDARTTALKNVLLDNIEAYNQGDAETYYKLFDMDKNDYNFNVAQLKALLASCRLTYTPEAIETAFLDDNNAQALVTLRCRADDLTTGEILYDYRTDITYTLVKNGSWKITQQNQGSEFDLMDTHTTDTAEK